MTYKPIPIVGPYKGIISDFPGPGDPQAFDDVLNFLMNKGRIYTRPQFNPAIALGSVFPTILGMTSFKDVTGVLHTLMLSASNAGFLTTPGPQIIQLPSYPAPNGSFPGTALYLTNLPYGMVTLSGRVYFCNGSSYVAYADGSNAIQTAGDVPGACYFLDVDGTGQALVGANWVEPPWGVIPTSGPSATRFANRVRWAASGNPNEWNNTVNYTAGLNDLEECPDDITGLATLGRNTYVFRTDGITVMYPTGIGLAPYGFEDLAKSLSGIGNVYPYSLAKFNDIGVFISANDIYMMQQGVPSPIAGGKTKRRIFADLGNISGDVVTGSIIPGFGPGFDFLSYWLNIPGPNVTWVYSFDDNNWIRVNLITGYISSLQQVYTS